MRKYIPIKTTKGEGELGAKTAKVIAHEGNVSKMIDFCKSAVKLKVMGIVWLISSCKWKAPLDSHTDFCVKKS